MIVTHFLLVYKMTLASHHSRKQLCGPLKKKSGDPWLKSLTLIKVKSNKIEWRVELYIFFPICIDVEMIQLFILAVIASLIIYVYNVKFVLQPPDRAVLCMQDELSFISKGSHFEGSYCENVPTS